MQAARSNLMVGWRACAVALSAVLAAGDVQAQAAAQSGADQRADKAGRATASRTEVQWLQLMQSAAQRLNYSGTIVYQMGGEVRSSRIIHYFDGTVSHERLQMLDGKPREFIRRDDEVQCLFPEARRITVERRPGQEPFPALAQGAPLDILKHYAIRLGGVERAAGHECQIIHLEPRDRLRYGYRLWVERGTGLLVKAQTINDRGDALEQIAFTDLRLETEIDPAQLRAPWPTEGWQIERAEHTPADLAKAGWTVRAPPGFRKTRAVERRLPGKPATEAMALQAVYSDGLATFSVFIEAQAGAAAAAEGSMQQGPTAAYKRRLGDALVTVVGEVPPATARDVAMAVEFRSR